MSTYWGDAHRRQLYPTADNAGIVREGTFYNDSLPSVSLPMERPMFIIGDQVKYSGKVIAGASPTFWQRPGKVTAISQSASAPLEVWRVYVDFENRQASQDTMFTELERVWS
jgi:hypothetical protein